MAHRFAVWLFAVTSWSSTAVAQPLFRTTFDCPDWDQTMGLGDADVCARGDGISGHGGWTTGSGSVDRITLAANHPGGEGGKGFRHFRGNGTNNNGGGLSISLPRGVTEMWVRLYMRYSAGFAWAGSAPLYTKDNYWGACGAGCLIFGIQGSHSWGLNYNGGVNYSSSLTWAESQGGPTGDGLWHAYEYHVRQNGSAATVEIWVDGTRVLNETGANLGSTPWSDFALGENQSDVMGCSPDCYTDYDDIVISTTGYIGPVGSVTPDAGVPPADGGVADTDASVPRTDAGAPPGRDGGLPSEVDGGSAVSDAAVSLDAAGPARDAGSVPPPDSSSGCACSAARPLVAPRGLLGLCALLCMWLLRRRARIRRPR